MLVAHRAVDDRLARGLRQYRPRSQDAAQPLAQPGRGGACASPMAEPVYREALERTIEEADGLIKTFNALLSIARLEAGAGGENRETLDVAALVRELAELYEPVAEERGLVLRACCGRADFRPRRSPAVGPSHRQSLDNAIKYGAPADGAAAPWSEARDRRWRQRRRGSMAEIVVTDRGPGCSGAERERVLGRFVRLEASRSEPGSGLGLSLVAAVARLHGGTLAARGQRARACAWCCACRGRATLLSTAYKPTRRRGPRPGRA